MGRAKKKGTRGRWSMDWDRNGSLGCQGREDWSIRVDQEESKRI